jgi:hypothetical protein
MLISPRYTVISIITSVRLPVLIPPKTNKTLPSPLHTHLAHPFPVGNTKRALATAMLIGGGGCGGIIASNVFRQQDAPGYRPGMIAVITSQVITVILVSKNFLIFWLRNRKADRGEVVLEGVVGFRYTY